MTVLSSLQSEICEKQELSRFSTPLLLEAEGIEGISSSAVYCAMRGGNNPAFHLRVLEISCNRKVITDLDPKNINIAMMMKSVCGDRVIKLKIGLTP
jgi:hypothetical protein